MNDGKINKDVNDIDVRAKDSKVLMPGTVSNFDNYAAIYDSTLYTPGVMEINDELSAAGE